jgi:hypothetical protein
MDLYLHHIHHGLLLKHRNNFTVSRVFFIINRSGQMFLRSGFHHIKIFTQYDGRRNEGHCSQNKTRFISCWIVSNYGVRALANEVGPLACFCERGHESRRHF